MPGWDGMPDSHHEPPDEGDVEEKQCVGCHAVKEVNVESDYCDDCLTGLANASVEARQDELKDEGRIA